MSLQNRKAEDVAVPRGGSKFVGTISSGFATSSHARHCSCYSRPSVALAKTHLTDGVWSPTPNHEPRRGAEPVGVAQRAASAIWRTP